MDSISFSFDGENCKLNVIRVAKENCLARKVREKRIAREYSIFYLLDGYGTLVVNGKEVLLSKGNIFLNYLEEPCEYFPDTQRPWSYVWIEFLGENIDRLLEACGFTKKKPYIYCYQTDSFVSEVVQPMLKSFNGERVQSMACPACVVLFFSRLIAMGNDGNGLGTRKKMRYRTFRNIVIFINNNYRMNLTIDELAQAMYVSRQNLISMFNEYAQMSPISYINLYRISTACVHLVETNKKIKEIAESVGIDDEAYFSRLFAKLKGETPKEYRDRHVASENPFAWMIEKNLDFA